MTVINERMLNDLDLVFKNFFDQRPYTSVRESKIGYPVDIIRTTEGVRFEIAAVGLEKTDVTITTEGETLRVAYKPDAKQDDEIYIHRGIARRSFDLAWKISSDLDLHTASATMDKGLLTVEVLFAESRAPKQLKIK
jgi:HSP20 family molecular chaperone IbpA